MPSSFVEKAAREKNIPIAEAEKKWVEAKSIASEKMEEDDPKFWGLVTHIFKNKMGLNESFREYIENRKIGCRY